MNNIFKKHGKQLCSLCNGKGRITYWIQYVGECSTTCPHCRGLGYIVVNDDERKEK